MLLCFCVSIYQSSRKPDCWPLRRFDLMIRAGPLSRNSFRQLLNYVVCGTFKQGDSPASGLEHRLWVWDHATIGRYHEVRPLEIGCCALSRDIAVSRHEYDRDANIRLSPFGLEVETADPRYLDIEDQAACNIRHLICVNSWAEPNSSTRKPIDRKRLLRVARITALSSMTKTVRSAALARSSSGFGRPVITAHPLDAMAM